MFIKTEIPETCPWLTEVAKCSRQQKYTFISQLPGDSYAYLQRTRVLDLSRTRVKTFSVKDHIIFYPL